MRRFLKFFALALALLLLLVVSSPYWLGALLPTVGKRLGATYASYSRNGYSRFVLQEVLVQRSTVTVHVDRVEADTPWLWGLRHLRRADRLITAGKWKLDVVSRGKKPESKEDSGWTPLDAQLSRIARQLDQWLPRAQLGAGEVNWPGGGLSLAAAEWRDRTLRAEKLRWRDDVADVDAAFPGERIRVTAKMATRPITLTAESLAGVVTGQLTFHEQPAPFEFKFGPTGWMPASGKIDAENWKLPASAIKLSGYSEVTGGAHATWERGQFDLNTDLRGVTTERRGAPDLHVIARAHGDPEAYVVEQLDVAAPGIQAMLNEPIRAAFHDVAAGPASRFAFTANLAEVPWFKAEGRVQGEVNVVPHAGAIPVFAFTASGQNLAYAPLNVKSVALRGELDWPRLTIGTAEIVAEGDARFTASGASDFRSKELLAVRADGRVTPGFVQPWMPKGISFSGATVALKASGPWATLKHEGAVQIEDLVLPGLVPAAVNAWWHGTGPTVEETEVGIHAGATEVVANGAVNREGAQLKTLIWRQAQQERLALQNPSTIRWSGGIGVDAFDLVGPAGELRLSGTWGTAGDVKFFARGIEAAWWRDFIPPTPFGWSIDTFSLTGKWDGGPASLTTSGKVFVDLQGRDRVTLDLAAHADAGGVVVEHLQTLEKDKAFATLQGKLPIAIWAGLKPHVDIGKSADLSVSGHVDPNARWWTELGDRTGVRLERPELSLQLDGTWEQPRGTAKLDVAGVRIDKQLGTTAWPTMENIHIQLSADGSHLKLNPAEATIQGQPIALRATMPTDRETWEKLRKDPVRVLRDEVEISLRATDTDVAAFTPYASGVLLPQGRLDADITLSVRGEWKGYLRMRDLATRPMGSMGPLRDIRAELSLENRRVVVKSIETAVGGQTVHAEGFVEVPVGKEPHFNLTAEGENLPFVRSAGLVVRGDVKMKVANDSARPSAPPTVSGEVRLHDGLFLSDVRALVPRGGGASPERRPPYFSVTAEPFNRWRLDMNVHGERFLRARTTLFNGVASTKFHLVGTLGEPRALGDVRIEDGQVLFPFARFQLQDATVRLSEENPYDPQLAIFGMSRRYGYDIKLEVTGAGSSPQVVFSSNPPLSSEQLLLLVMAGETPKNEVNYSTTQRFARLGTFFGQSLLSSLGGGGGGEDRLTISSGERVSRQGRETYDVEYKLNDRWAAVGEYDEFDAYNLGFKWRALPKKLRGEGDETK